MASGEFGAMGVEGAVGLAFRRELEEIPDDVIDPADTRGRLLQALATAPPQPPPSSGRRRTMVDSW